ncbi:acyltransferase family protein [Salinisphaera japonica]|uniref:Acyltransferase n=1 Tax=Salinisphaera japonica YTM-1 TaxID=1209778 RepID=A0A423PLD9_9GAMM|nr:acyltransferase family protein [Salinisphaera japonica]ROO26352.1 acyltransferase [Salinisphaera japonica YTM-1]
MIKYRPEIDGLRAVAVIPVILFHAGFSWVSGGFVGVDVFFVISGYLITAILLKDLQENRFSVVGFYERRARRILPALFSVLIVVTPLAIVWLRPSQLKDYSEALFATVAFSSNILYWLTAGYFEPNSDLNLLLHTWSLGVEEQFYLFFPLLLAYLWRRQGSRASIYIGVICFASILLAEVGWRVFPTANFYLLPSRAWELGAGSLCAFYLHAGNTQRSSQALSVVGLLLILSSVFWLTADTAFPSLATLLPVVGSALIILGSGSKDLIGRMLGSRPFVLVGKLSFSAYLWHQPLMALARLRSLTTPSPVLMGALAVASLGIAYLSWRFVEEPFRGRPGRRLLHTRSRVFSASALGSALLLAIGLSGYLGNGWPERQTPSGKSFSELKLENLIQINYGLSPRCEGHFTLSDKCRTGPNPDVLVWGDSYAMYVANLVRSSPSFQGHEMVQMTKSSCAPIPGIAKITASRSPQWASSCINFNQRVLDWLGNQDRIKYVVMSSPLRVLDSKLYFDNSIHGASEQIVLERLKNLAKRLRSMGKNPLFVGPTPIADYDLSSCPLWSLRDGVDYDCEFSIHAIEAQRAHVLTTLQSQDFPYPVFGLMRNICPRGQCQTVTGGGMPLFRDDEHLSVGGSKALGAELDVFGALVGLVSPMVANSGQDSKPAQVGLR